MNSFPGRSNFCAEIDLSRVREVPLGLPRRVEQS
jgi:hypothetical protein